MYQKVARLVERDTVVVAHESRLWPTPNPRNEHACVAIDIAVTAAVASRVSIT